MLLSTIQQGLKQHHLTLPEAAYLVQNHLLWWMMSTYGATQSWVACQKRRRRRGLHSPSTILLHGNMFFCDRRWSTWDIQVLNVCYIRLHLSTLRSTVNCQVRLKLSCRTSCCVSNTRSLSICLITLLIAGPFVFVWQSSEWINEFSEWMNESVDEFNERINESVSELNQWINSVNELSEWVNEWMNECSEWVSEWNEWVNEWMNGWMNECREWVTKWMNAVNEWVTKWMNAVNEWVSKWMNAMNECMWCSKYIVSRMKEWMNELTSETDR